MILTCPSCGTQYVVKDDAIPPGGRQVRCASCKHSWHQDQEGGAEAEAQPMAEGPAEAPVIEASAEDEESITEATLIDPRSGPEAEERAYEEAAIDNAEEAPRQPARDEAEDQSATYAGAQFDISKKDQVETPAESDWNEPPQPEAVSDDFAPYPAADEEAPRRRSPAVTILIVVLVVVVAAAAFWFLAPPEWKARLGLAAAGKSPLALVTTHMDRQRLESGQELLTVTGRVINPTSKEQQVPPLQAQLKTRTGKVVYSWTIPPPAGSLAPGASASFNSAELRVPPGGDELTITVGGAG
jgi:predicted Zn finger-like uncharacterized protein